MSLEADHIRAIIFDYGNTLIEFTYEHLEQCDSALAEVLERWYGHVDREQLMRIRNHDRVAPYSGDYRENHLPTITANLVHALYGHYPGEDLLKELLEVRFSAFISVIKAPDYLHDLFTSLTGRFKIGLLSNYPCGEIDSHECETYRH